MGFWFWGAKFQRWRRKNDSSPAIAKNAGGTGVGGFGVLEEVCDGLCVRAFLPPGNYCSRSNYSSTGKL